MTAYSLYIVGAAVVAALAFLVWPRRRLFPGPPQYGYLGSAVSTMRNMHRRHWSQLELTRKYGAVVEVTRFDQRSILLADPDDVHMMIENRDLFPDRPNLGGFQIVTPRGLLGLRVNDGMWAKHRRLLTPLFAEKLMRVYARLMDTHADRLCESIATRGDGKPVEVVPLMMAVAIDIIGVCGFDTEFGALDGIDDADHISKRFVQAAALALQTVIYLTFIPKLIRSLAPWKWNDVDRARKPFAEIVSRMRKEFDPSTETRTMLSELLHAERRGEMSADEINDEMRTLLLAGFETTANSVSWTLFELAKNPDVQARFHAISGEENRVKFARNAMMEALRLHPTVIATTRANERAFNFKGVDVPAGTLFVASFLAMNLNKKTWGDDVEVFRPERHEKEIAPAAFIPFGFGTRVCIGKRFAILEGETIISRILSRFKLSVAEGGLPTELLHITLSASGLKLLFEPI